MAFPPRFLDEIRNRLSLAETVGRRVKLTRRGREFVGLCPFHHEKTPSFCVVEEKNFYHCFGCGAHGDVIGFTMRAEGLPFPEAVEKLARDAGLELPERDPRAEEQARQAKTLYDANEAAAEWFAAQLYTPEGRTALDYLKRRGLEDRTIARFRLGYAPDARDAVKRALVPKGYSEDQLLEAGLLVRPEDGRSPYDRFRGRVMFPIADKRGRIIAFGGRVLGDEKPKYLNSPDTPLFHKGRVLYAYREARAAAHAGAEIIVAEGYMDVIALHQGGFEGALAPLGTALTEAQIEELWRVKPEPLLCFDGDEAGRRAAARAAERVLPILKPGHSLRFVFLPEGEDPDSLIRDGGAPAMKAVLDQAVPLVDWVWRIETHGRPLDTPERRAALRKALMDRAAAITERSIQEEYVAAFRERFDALQAARQRTRWEARRQGQGGGARGPTPGGRWTRVEVPIQSDGNTERVRLRAKQAMLGLVLLNPELIDEFREDLAQIDLARQPDLARLRDALLDPAAPLHAQPELVAHLHRLGFAELVKDITSWRLQNDYRNPASRSRIEAREIWKSIRTGLLDKTSMDAELAKAANEHAAEMTARSEARLYAVRRQAGLARGAEPLPSTPPNQGLKKGRA